MTIADYIEDRRKKSREKLRKEAEARGEARTDKEWDEWLARREASEATGEPFNESPPSRREIPATRVTTTSLTALRPTYVRYTESLRRNKGIS